MDTSANRALVSGGENQTEYCENRNNKRHSKDSIATGEPITCSFPHTVKEAVAIAAGKKGNDGAEDDDGKTIRSNMLCYLYWLLVMLILGLISFTVWLSIQLARRHSIAIMNQSKFLVYFCIQTPTHTHHLITYLPLEESQGRSSQAGVRTAI